MLKNPFFECQHSPYSDTAHRLGAASDLLFGPQDMAATWWRFVYEMELGSLLPPGHRFVGFPLIGFRWKFRNDHGSKDIKPPVFTAKLSWYQKMDEHGIGIDPCRHTAQHSPTARPNHSSVSTSGTQEWHGRWWFTARILLEMTSQSDLDPYWAAQDI